MTWEVALIGFLSASVSILINGYLNRKTSAANIDKMLVEADLGKANVARTQVETSLAMIEPLRQQLVALAMKVTELSLQVDMARIETEACHAEHAKSKLELDAAKSRISTLEQDLARYKGGPSAHHGLPQEVEGE